MDLDPSTLDRREAYQLLISAILPRPIAFVTTRGPAGNVNLAPFSYFNGVSSVPPIVSIAVGSTKRGRKDTWVNAERTGEFVVNVVVEALMDAVIAAAVEHPPEVSELELAGLRPAPSVRVQTPGVLESPVRMECRVERIVEVEGTGLILGRVLHVHADDRVVTAGLVDPRKAALVGRLGGDSYCRMGEIFERKRIR